jgi:recombinational DNA repair protein (RecF pathway)
MNQTTKAFILNLVQHTRKAYIIHSLTPTGRFSFYLASITPKNKSYEFIKTPLINVEITYNDKPSREHLYKVIDITIENFPHMVADHLLHSAIASFMAEIIMKITPIDLYDTQLYDIVLDFVNKLNNWEKIPNSFLLSFMAYILNYMGILSKKNYSFLDAMPHYESLLNFLEYLYLHPLNSSNDNITLPATPYHLLNLTISYLRAQEILNSDLKSLKVM